MLLDQDIPGVTAPGRSEQLQCTVIQPNSQIIEEVCDNWPEQPNYYHHIMPFVRKHLGKGVTIERVKLKAWNYSLAFRHHTDMLVDEDGYRKELAFNPIASKLYHETFDQRIAFKPPILGTVLIFSRPIWF